MAERRFISMRTLASQPERPGLLPVCPRTIRRWVAAGEFPAPVQLGGTKVWDAEAVTDFVRSKNPAQPA